MGSKSKSESSTSTQQTDSRQFQAIEQGLTDEAVGLGGEVQRGGRVNNQNVAEGGAAVTGGRMVSGNNRESGNRTPVNTRGHHNTVTNKVRIVDGGAIKAAENVASFAIDAVSGNAFSTVQQLGNVVSMLADNNRNGQEASYSAIEGILEEKQTDGKQDVQKYMFIALAVVGAALGLGMMGKSKK